MRSSSEFFSTKLQKSHIFYESVFRYKYEDSVQSMSALNTFADCIVTRNKKDYRKSVIPVYTIDELML